MSNPITAAIIGAIGAPAPAHTITATIIGPDASPDPRQCRQAEHQQHTDPRKERETMNKYMFRTTATMKEYNSRQ